MTKYAVLVRCSDCTDYDEQGCGDGQPWHIGPGDDDVPLFNSREAADNYGNKYCDNGLYSYEIEEVECPEPPEASTPPSP